MTQRPSFERAEPAISAVRGSEPFSERPRLVIDGLCKDYGSHKVFEQLSLEIGRSEVISVVGPSGCGKTTLLRCLGGLITPSHGSITLDGESVQAPMEDVGIVFQHFGLFPWWTVEKNIGYGLALRRAPRGKVAEAVSRHVELVGLQGFEKAYPAQLSGGMQQRVGLARALAIEPTVLLMDEPFGALDAQTREILQLELLRIWESQPTTMVFITHAIDEAVLMGDRVVVMKGRPATFADVIEIDLPRPRARKTTQSQHFIELRETVWHALFGESRDTP